MNAIKRTFPIVSCLFIFGTAHSQDLITMDEYYAGVDFSVIEITTQTVSPGLHVLFGTGGNVAVSIGDQGALIVDDQFPAMVPKIKRAVRQLGGGEVDFVINTHWHYDHSFGNPLFGETGSWIVAQANARQMMTETHIVNTVGRRIEQPPVAADGLPVISYGDRMQFHFNGEQIDLLHFGPAHTTGDGAIVFRGHNAVHMGDVYNNAGYPFIDTDKGGDLDGLISFCESVLDEINANTVVIPGHGKLSNYAEMRGYVEMLKTIRGRIATLIENGATLADVIAAKPTAEWDEVRGNPNNFLDRSYASLTR